MSEFKEMIIKMSELQDGDQVMGTDGLWHDIEILPIHTPERMFEISFGCKNNSFNFDVSKEGMFSPSDNEGTSEVETEENIVNIGSIKCSGDHLWTLFDANTKAPLVLETKAIFENIDWLKECNWGTVDGPKIVEIQEIEPIPSRCISLKDSEDMLFEVFTNKGESVFTHNCQQRLICGQLGSIASRMALDDNQATTIDGTHKGAGMTKAQGIVSNIQYYFEKQSWIEKWFTDRGLTPKGWEKSEDPNAPLDPDTIDLGEDEEITIDKNKTVIEFQDIRKEINNTKDQKFEQV